MYAYFSKIARGIVGGKLCEVCHGFPQCPSKYQDSNPTYK